MVSENLSKFEVERLRPDLTEMGFVRTIDEITRGEKPLYWINNFLYLFDTPLGWFRKIDSELAGMVDKTVINLGFEITQYGNREYCSTPEAHEKAFLIYKQLHEGDGLSFKRLFG